LGIGGRKRLRDSLDPCAGASVDRDRNDRRRREIGARNPRRRDRDEEEIERNRNQRETLRAAPLLQYFRRHGAHVRTHGRTPVIGSESKTSELPSTSAMTIALDLRTLRFGVMKPTMQPISVTPQSAASRGQAGAKS